LIDLARSIGIRATARNNEIHRNMLQHWIKVEEKFRLLAMRRGVNQYKRTRLDGNGRSSTIPFDTEEKFMDWFNSRRSEAASSTKGPIKVNIHMCVAAIRRIDGTMCQIPWHLLRRRMWRMLHRQYISDRAITHYAQKVRTCSEMIEGFEDYLQEQMKRLKIGGGNVCNFDQTNVFFSPDCKRTLATNGAKQVSALKKESNQRCTVMLGCSTEGGKFDPYIIWKGKNTPSGRICRQIHRIEYNRDYTLVVYEGFHTSNFYAVQENAWMESALVVQWLQKVCD
jgi:DDE superfamily endonuclease